MQIMRRRPNNINLGNFADQIQKYYAAMFDRFDLKNVRGALCLDTDGRALLHRIDHSFEEQTCAYTDRCELLIVGFLKTMSNKKDNAIFYEECRRFYHPPLDPHKNLKYLSHLSLIDNGWRLSLYEMKRAKECNVSIVNMMENDAATINNKQESILLTVANASIPRWIRQQFEQKLAGTTIGDANSNNNDLTLLFVKSIEWDNYLIILDNALANGYNFAIPSGVDIVSQMYAMSTDTNILCIDDENEICDYNVDADTYRKFQMDGTAYYGKASSIPSHSLQDSVGCGVCTFDHGTKLFMVCVVDIIIFT